MLHASLSAYRQVFAKEGIRAVAFIPLIGNAGLIGKFMLYYNEPHEFQKDELRVAQTIATHVALAAEQQHLEKALHESEKRFRAIFFQAAIGIALNSLSGEGCLYICEDGAIIWVKLFLAPVRDRDNRPQYFI